MTTRETRKARREAERAERKAAYKLSRSESQPNPTQSSYRPPTLEEALAKAAQIERKAGLRPAQPVATTKPFDDSPEVEQELENHYQYCLAQERAFAQAEAEDETEADAKVHSDSARAAVNRANSLHSTGPKTDTGKSRSSQNAFKHGLYSKQVVLPSENAAAFEALRADLRRDHQPINTTEEILVNELAENFWRMRRMRAYEASALGSGEISMTQLALIVRMMSSAERAFHKAQASLAKMQKARGFVPAEPPPAPEEDIEIEPADGFVPSTTAGQPATQPEPTAKSTGDTGFVSQNTTERSPLAA